MSRYSKYILLGTFFAAVLIIVYLYFNSNRNINALIAGNENLLEELSIKNSLQRLRSGLTSMNNRTREQVIIGTPAPAQLLDGDVHLMAAALVALDTLQSEQLVSRDLSDLRRLIDESIVFNRSVLDTLKLTGSKAARQMISAAKNKIRTDSINLTADKIDNLHQRSVTALILQADTNVQRARTIGSILALIAAIASGLTFIFVAYKVRSQEQLISKLNESEKQVRDNARIKENFLANMSHEIRTPLNAILGFTNLLAKQKLDVHSAEYVGTIGKSGEHLLNIVNEILDLSKIEAGMMRIEQAPFELRDQVAGWETMFHPLAAEKGLGLKFETDASVPGRLIGDAVRLNQIMVNLIGNAIKFTSNGIVTVSVSCITDQPNSVWLLLSVADTGIGIETKKLEHIFARFKQAEEEVTRKFGGTGLGLTIAKELIELQSGQIHVESEVDRGTTFRVRIPYKIAPQKAVDSERLPVPLAASPGPSATRILVAEDNRINQQLIAVLLKNRLLNYDLATNGSEALALLAEREYQLILMDIQMPEMDGYTATNIIRNTLKLRLPIVAMTAHAMQGERDKCLVSGMNGYLSKPIREAELDAVIAEFTGLGSDAIFKVIDTTYMKSVSAGNRAFEQTVTEQFIEAVPLELREIETAWTAGDKQAVHQKAHNMRTTVAIMGLNERLAPYLDVLEKPVLSDSEYETSFSQLRQLLRIAVEEAQAFREAS